MVEELREGSINTRSLKERVDIVELINEFVPLKRQGKDYFAKCPFHADNDPSFSVSPSKQMFYCHGCGAGGDILEFWMRFHKVPFPQAAAAIAEKYGIALSLTAPAAAPSTRPRRDPDAWQPKEQALPTDLWREKASKFAVWAYERLFEEPIPSPALQYLQERGLRLETIGGFCLGWNPGREGKTLFRDRESWGLLREMNQKTGRPRPLALPVGWVIPWFDEDGHIIRIRIRRPDPLPEGFKRYHLVEGSSTATMLIPPRVGECPGGFVREVYAIIEAELDAILVRQEAGDVAGAIALGSANTRPDAAATERLRKAVRILNALDFDRAGRAATAWWKEHFPDAERWPTPKGKDPGDAFKLGVNLREWIIAGLPEGLRYRHQVSEGAT